MVISVDERGNPELSEMVRRLVEVLQPDRIYLFGSQARGEATGDSDYDLLVIVPDPSGAERHRVERAYDALWGTNAAADVVVQTRDQFESRRHLRASLAGTVLREGKLLYDGR